MFLHMTPILRIADRRAYLPIARYRSRIATMIPRALLLVVAAAGLALAASAPAFAAQPYPLNFKTFDLGSPDSSSGTTYSGGTLTLQNTSLPALDPPYDDPFKN